MFVQIYSDSPLRCSFQQERVNEFDDLCSVRINDQFMLILRVFNISVRRVGTDVLAVAPLVVRCV